jgi:hypothetical protein
MTALLLLGGLDNLCVVALLPVRLLGHGRTLGCIS